MLQSCFNITCNYLIINKLYIIYMKDSENAYPQNLTEELKN